MKRSVLVDVICFLLIFLFTYTALSKLFNHEMFQAQLSVFPVIYPLAVYLSWALPLCELLIALFLLFPNLKMIGLYASSALLILFTIYLFAMILEF